MTELVAVPAAPVVPPFPALGDPAFNQKAYDWGVALPGVSGEVQDIAVTAHTNATVAKEQALASASSASAAAGSATLATTNGAAQVTLATAQADLAMGYRNTAGLHAATATDKAAQAVGDAAAALGYRNTAQTAAGNATAEADRARDEANRAEGYAAGIADGPVTSVNGRTGIVVGLLEKSGDSLTGAINSAPPVAVASAALTNIGAAASNNVTITGTVSITSLGTIAAGATRTVTFSGALTLTHNATSLILPGAANITTAAGDAAEFLSLGGGNWRCTAFQKASGAPVVAPPTIANLVRSDRTSNTVLGAADKGTFVDITAGTFTQTFAAAATLGNGWWCYLRNIGTGDITLDPNASELIDGLTSYIMYPGECRLVQCDGGALRTVVLNSFYKTFTASGNFIKPPGYSTFDGLLWSGGGSGRVGGTSSERNGGGGGACCSFSLRHSDVGATQTVTIGAGGLAMSTASTNGNAGGNSEFNGITAFGGKGGSNSESTSTGNGGVAFYGFLTGSSSQSTASASTTTSSIYGGGNGGERDASGAGQTVYGGAGGMQINSSNIISVAGSTIFGGTGGATNSSGTSATSGSSPGGGGGAATNGSSSGAGARGELRIWGII